MSIRKIQRKIKNRFVKKTARKLKGLYFAIVDFLGSFIFWLGRAFRIISPIYQYSKDKVKRILVIRTDKIGDVVLSTPAVRALRRNFPESFIGFLTTEYTKDLVSENKDIDEVIVYICSVSLAEKIRFIKRLKECKFDLAIILSPHFESALFGYLSGAAFRVGYPLNGSGFLLTAKVDVKNRCKHETESCLEVVRAIGVDTKYLKPELSISKEAQEYAERFFSATGIQATDLKICIHPGGYEGHTRWMPERYAQVADILISQYQARVILLGARADKEIIDKIIKLMSQRAVVSDLDISLQKLAAVIKRCDVFLGNNSGPMHIAAAVGTKVVAIFGAIHPMEHENKWRPFGQEHIVVRKDMDCVDCHPAYCKHLKCLQTITVNDVLEAISKQIMRIK